MGKKFDSFLDTTLGKWGAIEKTVVGAATAIGVHQAITKSAEIAGILGAKMEFFDDHPYLAAVVGGTTSVLLANLLGRGTVALTKAFYKGVTGKRNVVSRPGAVAATTGSPITAGLTQDLSTDKSIIDTKIRNLEDSRTMIDQIINKVEAIQHDLETAEANINAHINGMGDDDANEVHAHYGGNDIATDIRADGSLQHNIHYLTTKDCAQVLSTKKDKKAIIDNYLPRLKYDYDIGGFNSTGQYYIGKQEIGPWLARLQNLRTDLNTDITTLANRGRAANVSQITLNQLDTQMNSGTTANLCTTIQAHIDSLGISNIKDKERPAELTLSNERKALGKSIENSRDESKNRLQKLLKKVGL